MPVIVIGADTPLGNKIVEALTPRQGEVRAFVSDVEQGLALRKRGVKVAIGDVSDGSHVGAASMRAFCAVIVSEAASDSRERAFASSPDEVFRQWIDGLADAGVTRAIWVGSEPPPEGLARTVREQAHVDPSEMSNEDIADRVSRLEDAAHL